jgi:hypothetical protein
MVRRRFFSAVSNQEDASSFDDAAKKPLLRMRRPIERFDREPIAPRRNRMRQFGAT